MFDQCPFERMTKFRLSGGITKASRLAKWSKCTGRNTSSTWDRCSEKRLMAQLSTWASTPARW
ncbi:hypothetical protein LEMLEM_LOCUS27657 [Lemmus lemmus]